MQCSISRSSNKSSVFQERNLLAATGKDAIRNLLDPTSSPGIGEHTQVRRSLSVRCVTDGLCAATTSPSTHGDTWPPRRSHLGKQRCGTSTRSPQPRLCPLAQHYRSACCCLPRTDFLWDSTLDSHWCYAGTDNYEGKAADTLMGKTWLCTGLCCTYFALCNGTFCLLLCNVIDALFCQSLCTMFVLKFLPFSLFLYTFICTYLVEMYA